MTQKRAGRSPLRHVDPFIGVGWPGNGLCGPYLPNSLVRLGPDCLPPVDTTGYASGRPILRFSHTHVSGTGGGGRYGNIGVTPFVGRPRIGLDAYASSHETAAAGYYSVKLNPGGVTAELTSTPRVGVHRYSFPAGADANVLIDAGAVVQVAGAIPGEWTGASIGGFLEFVSETELVGRADCRGRWGRQFPYSVFFYASFDRPTQQRLVANAAGIAPGAVAKGPNCKAVAHFERAREVNLRVGISYVSVANARASAARETAGKSFDGVRREAAAVWDKALSRIRVEGGSADQKKLFYTLFARLICMPSDLGVDDEFAGWRSGARHFTDYYCLWDSVRNANSLISLFDPALEVAMLNCLLDVADHVGWIPDAWIAGHSATIQGGSSADILLCEAALKGLPGIDYERALRQMRKNNEVESSDPWMCGRYLKDYRDLGYLSTRVPQCVSRHLEYAYQDWCIGALARHLGHQRLARSYFQSSRKLRKDMKKLRAGVIGLGMGHHHASEFKRHPQVDLTAIADVDEGRLKRTGDELGVAHRYTSGEEMIENERLDIVSVTTSNSSHMPLTVAALKAGCHVLCEKPMAMNAREGAQMVKAAKDAGRRLMINFSHRFTPQSMALKKEVGKGVLGDIYFARTVWLRRRGIPGFGGWFGRKALSGGGPLIDLGVHRLDLALWLMGYPEPTWVMGATYDPIASRAAKAERKAYDVEDLAVALVRFESGAALELEASWAGNIKERELMETRLLGTEGGLVQRNLNEGYEFEAEIFVERDGVQYDLKPHAPIPTCSSAMWHFADSILTKKPHIATGEEGLIVMRLLDAVYASAAKGQPVQIGQP